MNATTKPVMEQGDLINKGLTNRLEDFEFTTLSHPWAV